MSASYPDFTHKESQEGLWLDDRDKPSWVEAEVAAMAPGTVQLNRFSWNRKLQKHVKDGHPEMALQSFKEMQREGGISPDKFTFVQVLNACASLRALEDGRGAHKQIIQNGCELDKFVASSLVDMYAKCGSLPDAVRVFNKMPSHNVVSWNIIISGHVKCGQGEKALELFQQMQWEGLLPDPVTFVAVLNACASVRALEEGRRVHEHIIQYGFESNRFVGGSLVDMYAKCGSMEDAVRVFDKMPTRDVVSWNVIIAGHVKSGQAHEALDLFRQMQREDLQPDPVTFVGVLNACASVGALEEGRHAHEHIIRCGCESNKFVVNSLVDMYAKCGRLEDATRVFSKMPLHDVVSWNVIIAGHVTCGQGQKALELFQQMQQEGVQPDCITFVALLNACASVMALGEGKRVHEQITQSPYESNLIVGNSLVDMYAKCGSMEDAVRVFEKMPLRDVVSWNVIISGYVKCGQEREALELFQQMQQEGLQPDSVTFVAVLNACALVGALKEGRRAHEHIIECGCELNKFVGSSLIDMYAKCGSLDDALRVFNNMPLHDDVISWNALISGYVKGGQGQKALELFQQMRKGGLQPDSVTFVALLNACASVGALEEGRCVHEHIIQYGSESNKFVGSSLVDMYAKCGSMADAWRVFSEMPSRDVVSWTAMLQGFAMHGHGDEALEHFEHMCEEGIEVHSVAFICLLSACSHAGLVDEGLGYFDSMGSVYGICATAEHYTCIVDLLGRAGRLQEAEDMIHAMPYKLSAPVWKALLSACRIHGNVEMGERITEQVLKLDPDNASG
jgi:pentatricopeptide repeat protein